jgi:hypothetical protein
MDLLPDALPDDVAALKAAFVAERARRLGTAAELAVARAKASECVFSWNRDPRVDFRGEVTRDFR